MNAMRGAVTGCAGTVGVTLRLTPSSDRSRSAVLRVSSGTPPISSDPAAKCLSPASKGLSTVWMFAPFSLYTRARSVVCPVFATPTSEPEPSSLPASDAGSSTGFMSALRMAVSGTRVTFRLNNSLNDQPVSS